MADMTEEQVLKFLITQVEMISGRKCADPEASLSQNGINSMGFMELLLALQMKYEVNLIDHGITAADVTSLHSLAQRVIRAASEA